MTTMKKPINILLVGPSGGGKGTQAKMIAETFGMKHLQSGEILRTWASTDNEFGRKVNAAMKEGFVPSEWIFKMIQEEFKKVGKSKGLILDSFSRILPEAKMLNDVLEKSGRSLDYVFYIKISDDEAIKRLSKRGVCGRCKEILMLDDIKDMRCPKCGGVVIVRQDDNPQSIKKRLEDFKAKTMEVIEYFKNTGKVIEINGEQAKEKVFADIIRHIEG